MNKNQIMDKISELRAKREEAWMKYKDALLCWENEILADQPDGYERWRALNNLTAARERALDKFMLIRQQLFDLERKARK